MTTDDQGKKDESSQTPGERLEEIRSEEKELRESKAEIERKLKEEERNKFKEEQKILKENEGENLKREKE